MKEELEDDIFTVEVEFKGKKIVYDIRKELAIEDISAALLEQVGKYVFWARLAKNADIHYRQVEVNYSLWLSVASSIARNLLVYKGEKVTNDAIVDTVRWVFSSKLKSDKKLRKEYLNKVLVDGVEEPLKSYMVDLFSVEDDSNFKTWEEWQENIFVARVYREMLSVIEMAFLQRKDVLQSLRALSSSDYAMSNRMLERAVKGELLNVGKRKNKFKEKKYVR